MGKVETSSIGESAYDFVINGKEPPEDVIKATIQRSEELISSRTTSPRPDSNRPKESSEASLDTGKK